MQREYGSLGTTRELVCGLLLVQVEAPVPRRDRHAGAEAPERGPVDLRALAVQDGRGRPARARLAERGFRLVVPGHEQGGRVDLAQRRERLLEPTVNRGEVARGDHDVGVAGHVRELPRLIDVAMQVAEGVKLHATRS